MSQGSGESRYFSNGWLIPIAEEAKPIFAQFPPETAIEVATAVLKGADSGETVIPWTTVFPSDDKQQVGGRLLQVLQTPDYQTPAYNPDTHLAVEELNELLNRHQAWGLQGKHAAYHLVRTAADKPEEKFLTYQDIGRKWPQYATDWIGQLKTQFGNEGYEEIRTVHPEFAVLLGKTAAVAELHYQQKGEIPQPGETAFDVITRVAQMFDLTSIESLSEASRVLGQGFEGYRKAAYQIRGLQEPTS
ncbi:MAG TPA: hypothetical protein VFM05_02485 [Candidatus Saccharimonadales bacterium]|nr:hypothetical protein [Candidatus Saccharimonadales bacterium]